MPHNQEIVHQAIVNGLLEFGEPVMKTIVWHLNAHGIFLDSSNEIDIRLIYRHLEEIVGNVADIAIESIYDNLRSRTQVGNLPDLDTKDSMEPALDRIEQLMIASNHPGGAN